MGAKTLFVSDFFCANCETHHFHSRRLIFLNSFSFLTLGGLYVRAGPQSMNGEAYRTANRDGGIGDRSD